jgi:UTP:GlnB (protein PII) uridylyltransferase
LSLEKKHIFSRRSEALLLLAEHADENGLVMASQEMQRVTHENPKAWEKMGKDGGIPVCFLYDNRLLYIYIIII